MNWKLAAAAPSLIGLVFFVSGYIHPAILAYHALCAAAIFHDRTRLKTLFRVDRSTMGWAMGTTGVIGLALLLAPWIYDPTPHRSLFLSTLFPRGDPQRMFWLFAAYTMAVHVPLEEIFWRGVVMDPERSALPPAIAGNALFFGLLHAVPMAMLLGLRGALFAGPTLAAGAVWAFVAIRSRSLWPGLVSHWGADALILAGMWFYFIR